MVEFAVAAAVLVALLLLLLGRQRPEGPAPEVEPRGSIDQVAALAREGHRVRAIAMFRDISGCSITEAHDAVDRLARGEPAEVAPAPTRPAEPAVQADPEVLRLVEAGELIPAIKRVRELTGLGLKEAKELVDGLRARGPRPVTDRPAPPPEPSPQARPQDGAAAASDPEVVRLVGAGELISAIKRVRELTGLGLKESKDLVDALRARPASAAPPPAARDAVTPDVSDLGAMARAGRLIEAIKLYRERTGVGLKEAKDAVERLRDGG